MKNINLYQVDKVLDDYVTTHKKICFYLIGCSFNIEFHNNFITTMDIGYCDNMDDISNIKSFSLYWINIYKSRGLKFYKITEVTIRLFSDKCNVTYEYYMIQPMQSVELRINMIIAKNPKMINSLDRSKNHPLIRKDSHFPINN